METIIIPEAYSAPIKQIIEWNLEFYMPSINFDTYLKRILEHFYQRNLVEGMVQVEKKDLYYIFECIGNATNNVNECGVEKDSLWEIYDWIASERKK